MAHVQKPEFVFPRNGRVHLNRWGRQFSRLLAVEECGSVVLMVVMLNRTRSEIKWNCTGYPLHSPVSPSLPLPCVTVCHQVPNELYCILISHHDCFPCSYFHLTADNRPLSIQSLKIYPPSFTRTVHHKRAQFCLC